MSMDVSHCTFVGLLITAENALHRLYRA